MGLKIFKVIWFFSLLTLLGVFMYVYASLPDPVAVGEGSKIISKEGLFYMLLAVLALANASVFAISRLLPEKDHDFKAWYYGLVVCANLFFVVGLAFISLFNSTEKFDYPRIGFIIYGSLILLIGWSISWPIFRFAQRIYNKQTI
jgi:hypothetical protein